MSTYRISEVSRKINLSADTLRYYEKIGLLPPVSRNSAGIRVYDDQDLSRLGFIRRAQTMNFSLAEIGQLLEMRTSPQNARNEVRELTQRKLLEVEKNLGELGTLRDELQLLVNLCQGSEEGCPILEGIAQKEQR